MGRPKTSFGIVGAEMTVFEWLVLGGIFIVICQLQELHDQRAEAAKQRHAGETR